MHSKRKIPDSWPTGWIAKACTSFVLYLNVFKNHLYYLRHIRVLSIKPCLHTQLPEHNKSYGNVSRGWGHLITWNGTMMGHLNNFSASGGGNLNKKLQKFKCPAGGGMLKLRFDWYIIVQLEGLFLEHKLSKKGKVWSGLTLWTFISPCNRLKGGWKPFLLYSYVTRNFIPLSTEAQGQSLHLTP